MRNTLTAIIIISFSFGSAYSQRASDYFPLGIGYTLIKHSFPTGGSGWGERLSKTEIIKADTIPSLPGIYYCDVEQESAYTMNAPWHQYNVYWVQSDGAGNILVGAVGSTNLDSATILNPPVLGQPNDMLTVGYTRTLDVGAHRYAFDSTESNSDIVSVPAGIFTGCLRISEVTDSMGIVLRIDYLYYAPHVGSILNVRQFPSNQTHRSELINYDVTSVNEDNPEVPTRLSLYQNYPNPFNPSTSINYQLPKQSHVTLEVFDVLGREIATLVSRVEEPGYKSVTFDASKLSSGVYYYRLVANAIPSGQSGNYFETKKLLLLR